MAKKKAGRPKTNRNDASTKLDKGVIGMAKKIALVEGVSVAEYLSEILIPIVKERYRRLLKEEEADPR